MKIQYRDVESFVKNPKPEFRAILVYGPDLGLVTERALKIAHTVAPDLNDAFSVVTLSEDDLASDPARLLDEATALTFGGGRRLVRLRNIRSGRDSSEKIVPAFKNFLSHVTDKDDCLIIVDCDNLPPKSALRKLFESDKKAAALACYAEDGADLTSALRQIAQEQGLRADPDALQFIAEHVRGDRMVARSEMIKIACYMTATPETPQQLTLENAKEAAGLGGMISLNDITACVASGQLDMLDRLMIKAFAEGMAPVSLMRAAVNYFRRIHLAKSYAEQGLSQQEIFEKKLQPAVFFKEKGAFASHMQRWPIGKLEKALDMLNETERQLKQTGAPAQTLCAQALIRLARAA